MPYAAQSGDTSATAKELDEGKEAVENRKRQKCVKKRPDPRVERKVL